MSNPEVSTESLADPPADILMSDTPDVAIESSELQTESLIDSSQPISPSQESITGHTPQSTQTGPGCCDAPHCNTCIIKVDIDLNELEDVEPSLREKIEKNYETLSTFKRPVEIITEKGKVRGKIVDGRLRGVYIIQEQKEKVAHVEVTPSEPVQPHPIQEQPVVSSRNQPTNHHGHFDVVKTEPQQDVVVTPEIELPKVEPSTAPLQVEKQRVVETPVAIEHTPGVIKQPDVRILGTEKSYLQNNTSSEIDPIESHFIADDEHSHKAELRISHNADVVRNVVLPVGTDSPNNERRVEPYKQKVHVSDVLGNTLVQIPIQRGRSDRLDKSNLPVQIQRQTILIPVQLLTDTETQSNEAQVIHSMEFTQSIPMDIPIPTIKPVEEHASATLIKDTPITTDNNGIDGEVQIHKDTTIDIRIPVTHNVIDIPLNEPNANQINDSHSGAWPHTETTNQVLITMINTHSDARNKLFTFIADISPKEEKSEERTQSFSNNVTEITSVPLQTLRQFLIGAGAQQVDIQGEILLDTTNHPSVVRETYAIQDDGHEWYIQVIYDDTQRIQYMAAPEANSIVKKRLKKYLNPAVTNDVPNIAPEEDGNTIKTQLILDDSVIGFMIIVYVTLFIPEFFDHFVELLIQRYAIPTAVYMT